VVSVRVLPGARRPGIVGVHGGAIRVRVSAPPEGGRANRELERLLAATLALRPSAGRVVGGTAARDKRLLVLGLDAAEVSERLLAGARPPGVSDDPRPDG